MVISLKLSSIKDQHVCAISLKLSAIYRCVISLKLFRCASAWSYSMVSNNISYQLNVWSMYRCVISLKLSGSCTRRRIKRIGEVMTVNLRTKILDFRGFDSSIISMLRGGILMPTGNFPESLSQAILVGIILVGRLGVHMLTSTCARIPVWCITHAHTHTCTHTHTHWVHLTYTARCHDVHTIQVHSIHVRWLGAPWLRLFACLSCIPSISHRDF